MEAIAAQQEMKNDRPIKQRKRETIPLSCIGLREIREISRIVYDMHYFRPVVSPSATPMVFPPWYMPVAIRNTPNTDTSASI